MVQSKKTEKNPPFFLILAEISAQMKIEILDDATDGPICCQWSCSDSVGLLEVCGEKRLQRSDAFNCSGCLCKPHFPPPFPQVLQETTFKGQKEQMNFFFSIQNKAH